MKLTQLTFLPLMLWLQQIRSKLHDGTASSIRRRQMKGLASNTLGVTVITKTREHPEAAELVELLLAMMISVLETFGQQEAFLQS